MNRENAIKLANKIGINFMSIVREEYEMLILEAIYASPMGDYLIFKGGTALRLAYDSPRFSEDLDFSTVKSFSCLMMKSVYENLIKSLPYLSLVDFREKYHTCFALFKIKEPFLPQAFSIKVEISKRKVGWKKNIDYQENILHSPTMPTKVFALTTTQEHIFQNKKLLLTERQKARDLFDLWYLSKLLKKEVDLSKTKLSSQKIKSELNSFLPIKYRRVYKELAK